MRPGKEGQDRAGLALLVAIIKVIGAGIVEIDGLLDQPQPEHAGEEIEIAVGAARDGGDVMDAGHGHSPGKAITAISVADDGPAIGRIANAPCAKAT